MATAACENRKAYHVYKGYKTRNSDGSAEIAGLDIAGLDNDGLDIDGLDNDGRMCGQVTELKLQKSLLVTSTSHIMFLSELSDVS